MNGIININKPIGITSYQVVHRVKKVSGQKKAGHIGTLDPLASGVLPVFLGKMTKLIPLFNKGNKTYEVAVQLGAFSTTQDSEGELTEVPLTADCNEEKIHKIVKGFQGEIEQIPPMYSAVRVKGQKLYKLARQGLEVERPPRKITIYSINNISVQLPQITFSVHCSKGTYMRVLAEDIGKSLGTGAYVVRLNRIHCEDYFTLDNAVLLDQIERLNKAELEALLVDPLTLLPDWHVVNDVAGDIKKDIGYGRPARVSIDSINFSGKRQDAADSLAIDQNKRLIAIGSLEFSQDSQCIFKPSKVLI